MMPQQPPQQVPGPQGQPQGQDKLMSLVNGIGDGLMQFQQILGQAQGQVPPEFEQRLGGIIEQYTSLISDLSTGGQQAAPAQAPQGQPVPMEAGRAGTPRL